MNYEISFLRWYPREVDENCILAEVWHYPGVLFKKIMRYRRTYIDSYQMRNIADIKVKYSIMNFNVTKWANSLGFKLLLSLLSNTYNTSPPNHQLDWYLIRSRLGNHTCHANGWCSLYDGQWTKHSEIHRSNVWYHLGMTSIQVARGINGGKCPIHFN